MSVDEMQFGSMPERGTTDAVSMLRRMQYEYDFRQKKLYMCFVDLWKTFYSVPKKALECVEKKKVMSEAWDRSEVSLHEGAKTRVRVDFEWTEWFEAKVRMKQGSVLSPFILVDVVDVITDLVREGALSE